MLNDTKNQKFDCIIVKDFSRFGRDYIEVGSYLEQIFPFLGIRFISINDYYDSANYQGSIVGLDVNFKNLLYDLYSKDLSQKVKTSLRAKKESGQYVSAHAPFGYEKSPDDRHMLLVCEEEAKVVQEIFSLALQGVAASQIAKKLNMEDVPTPLEFKIRKGCISRKPKGDKFFWSSSVIYRILRNPVYVGDIAYDKTEKEQVGGRNILRPREEWKIVTNHHMPVIAREDFEKVQKGTERRSRKRERGKGYLLAGRVVCGYCRHRLQIKDKGEPYFICPNRYVMEKSGCAHKISVVHLEQVVLFRLEKYLEERGLTEEIAARQREELQGKRASLLRDMRQEEREYGRFKRKHYEGYNLYAVGEQGEFYSYYVEMQKKQEIIQGLQGQISQIDKRISEVESGKCIVGENGLAEEMMEWYIEEIVIYGEEEVEIKWKLF